MKEYSGRNTLSSIVSIIKKACMPMVKGKAGQVVGFDANGKPVAQNAPSSTGGVTSFNGRTGAVTPMTGDYTADQVGALPSDGGLIEGNVQILEDFWIGSVATDGYRMVEIWGNTLRFYNGSEFGGVAMRDESGRNTDPVISFYGINGGEAVKLNNIEEPSAPFHAANKRYVDTAITNAINAIVYSTMHTGTSAPTAALGENGDVYLQT